MCAAVAPLTRHSTQPSSTVHGRFLLNRSWQLTIEKFMAVTFRTGHVGYLLNRARLLPVERVMAVICSAVSH